jgi:hypothetical protein
VPEPARVRGLENGISQDIFFDRSYIRQSKKLAIEQSIKSIPRVA